MTEGAEDDDNREIDLERLKQRYKLAGIILGTSLVSILASWFVFAEKTQVNENVFDKGHRDFIADFVQLALEEDIELRLRFASYFSRVTLDFDQRARWEEYEAYLIGLKDGNQKRLQEIEDEISSAGEAEINRLRSERDFLLRQLEGRSVPPSTLSLEGRNCKEAHSDFPAQWLCIAKQEVGEREVAGEASNSRILGYASSIGLDYDNDDIPWTGLFAAWVVAQSDAEIPLPDNPLRARDWLQFGESTDQPNLGDILVFWRGSVDGPAGHVGFYAGEDDNFFQVLGGNQSNSVNIMNINKNRLLEARTWR